MSIKHIVTDSVLSSPLYSQGIIAGKFLFTSGQIGLNNLTGQLENETFEDEFRQTLENIRLILESDTLGLEDIIKITIFITDVNLIDSLNNIYLKYFPIYRPARSCIVVSSLAKSARVEMEAVAFKDEV